MSLSSSYSGISFLKYHFKFQIKSSGSSNCSSLRDQSWGHILPRWWGLTTTTRTALDSVCDTLVRGYSDYASQYVVHWKGLVKTARARWTSFDKLSAPFLSVRNTCHRYLFQYQFAICIVGQLIIIIIYIIFIILCTFMFLFFVHNLWWQFSLRILRYVCSYALNLIKVFCDSMPIYRLVQKSEQRILSIHMLCKFNCVFF